MTAHAPAPPLAAEPDVLAHVCRIDEAEAAKRLGAAALMDAQADRLCDELVRRAKGLADFYGPSIRASRARADALRADVAAYLEADPDRLGPGGACRIGPWTARRDEGGELLFDRVPDEGGG